MSDILALVALFQSQEGDIWASFGGGAFLFSIVVVCYVYNARLREALTNKRNRIAAVGMPLAFAGLFYLRVEETVSTGGVWFLLALLCAFSLRLLYGMKPFSYTKTIHPVLKWYEPRPPTLTAVKSEFEGLIRSMIAEAVKEYRTLAKHPGRLGVSLQLTLLFFALGRDTDAQAILRDLQESGLSAGQFTAHDRETAARLDLALAYMLQSQGGGK